MFKKSDADLPLTEFDEIAARLKHELHLKKDYELAKFFGISAPSFNARKKNNNFPIKKLKEILELRPDLSYVDLRWVLTGKTEIEELYGKTAPMSSTEFNIMSEDMITKLRELPRKQQESVYTIIKEFHRQMNTIKWDKLKRYETLDNKGYKN